MKKCIVLLFLFLFLGVVSAVSSCDFADENLQIISVGDLLADNYNEWRWEKSENVEVEVRLWNKNTVSGDYIVELNFIKDGKIVDIVEDSDDIEKEVSLGADEKNTVSFSFKILKNISEDDYEMYIVLSKKSDSDICSLKKQNVKIISSNICPSENINKSVLEIVSLTSGNNWDWRVYDDIYVNVKIDSSESKDYIMELVLLDMDGHDVDFTDDVISKTVSVKEGSQIIKFNFTLNGDVDAGKYELYTKLYSGNNCESLRAEKVGSYVYINVNKSGSDVEIKDVYGNKERNSNTTEDYILTIVNKGIEQKNVSIYAFNYIIGLKESVIVGAMDAGEVKNVSVSIPITDNLTVSRFNIEFSVIYDYKDGRFNKYSDDYNYHITYNKTAVVSPVVNDTSKNDSVVVNDSKKEEIENVVETKDNNYLWVYIASCVVITVAGFFIVRKLFGGNKRIKSNIISEPRISRVYKAKLH